MKRVVVVTTQEAEVALLVVLAELAVPVVLVAQQAVATPLKVALQDQPHLNKEPHNKGLTVLQEALVEDSVEPTEDLETLE
jgi:hypothetical protein